MTFPSQYASKIWDTLYTVFIPDQITLDKQSIKRFGTYVTQIKPVDEMLKTNLIMVKIPVIQILSYFVEGIEIQIPSREDMIHMHKDIEAYLTEWKEYIRNSVHGHMDAQNNKDLVLSLEKLSKYVYEKAKPVELINNLYLNKKVNLGLMTPLQQFEERNKVVEKPDYEEKYAGIKNLIVKKKPSGNGGRFS